MIQKQKSTLSTPFTPSLRNMESNHKPLVMLRCKLIILGDACVGKTALSQVFQFGSKSYPKNYMMTIGADFGVKAIPFPEKNAVVELYIHDCAGQSIFNQVEMNSKYYDNASAMMIVYDIGNMESLQNAVKWIQDARKSRQGLDGVLVGNKSDFREGGGPDSRAEVVREDAKRLAEAHKLDYFETSAATNTDVEHPFKFIAEKFYDRYVNTVRRADGMSGV